MTDTLSPHADNGRFSYILIPVSRQSYALVDFADADLADFTWSYSSGGYAVRNKGGEKLFMHRIIMERVLGRPVHKGYHIDHINGNSFDNRRANLREVTPQQNIFNRKRKSTAQGSRYKGVGPKGDKWIAAIGYQGKNLHIGIYDDELEAAQAYDAAALTLYGEFARINGLLESVPPGFVLRSRNSPIISTNTSGYRGIYKLGKRWIARIEVDGKCVSLGGFSNPEEAARAYDRAAIEQHGSKAITNFPLSDYEGGK